MWICKGWDKRPLSLSPQLTYQPEALIRRVLPSSAPPASPLVCQPIWVVLEGKSVRVRCKEEIELACRLVCIHHNNQVEQESEDDMSDTTEDESDAGDTEEECSE